MGPSGVTQQEIQPQIEVKQPVARCWRVELLGGLRVVSAQRSVDRFPTQKVAALLACLAYYLDRPHRREELIERLWPECDPAAGHHSLRQALVRLRHSLEPLEIPTDALLLVDRHTVRLNPACVSTDVAEFEAALRAAEAVGEAGPAEPLAAAVDRYGGELLPGYYEDWILQERQWLAGRYFQALERLLAHLEGVGDFERALEYAHRGVAADPLREEAHRDLIRVHAVAGQPSAALRQYQELKRLLKEQLGTSPEAATRALVREIRRLTALRPVPVRLRPAARTTPLGQPASSEEREQRLVTLLFVAFSPSPETSRARVRGPGRSLEQAMVEVILKYGGQIEAFEGEGLMAVFGAAQAHEDDPERAIRAALEIREATQHLGLRVTAGIDTGQVSIESSPYPEGRPGSARGQEAGVAGPAVSRAARLQEQAAPGQILVGEAARRLTHRAFRFHRLAGEISSAEQPPGEAAYTVEGIPAHPRKARGIEGLSAPLVGREEELAKLRAALAKVAGVGGQGQMVSLIGEAGVGKSRLVAELKQWASQKEDSGCPPQGGGQTLDEGQLQPNDYRLPTGDRGLLWLEGRCRELSMGSGYSLFLDLLRDYFAWRPDEDAQARTARLCATLLQLEAQAPLPSGRAQEIGALLGNLLSARLNGEGNGERPAALRYASPEQLRHRTFLAIRDFLLALARLQPLVLVLEDLHWADRLSLDALPLLMELLPQAPLLLLCVYRPEQEHRCRHLAGIATRKCPDRYTEIPLQELGLPQSRQLLASLLGIEQLPDPVKTLILEQAHGNPFFLEEMVRSLMDAGAIYQEAGGDACTGSAESGMRNPEPAPSIWRARGTITAVTLPESVQSVILSRVDQLQPELKEVLQRVAIIGPLFRPSLLERAVGSGERTVGCATQDQLLPTTGAPFVGTPPLPIARCPLPAALWELEERGLIYQERATPEEEYAFRHALTQETIYGSIPPRARATWHRQVGEALEALYPERRDEHLAELAYHFSRSDATSKAVEYLLQAGEQARRAYLNDAAISYLQQALERLGPSCPAPATDHRSRHARLEALRGLGQVYAGTGRLGEAEACFRPATALGHEIGLPAHELVRLYWWLAEVLLWQDRLEETIQIGREGLTLLGDDTESVEAVLMNDCLAWCYTREDPSKRQELNQQNAKLLEQLPYSEELRPVYANLVHMAYGAGKIEEALKWVQALEQRGEQHHDLAALAEARIWQGTIASAQGNLHGAVLPLQQSLELLAEIGDAKLEIWSLLWLGTAFLSLGHLAEARQYLRRGLETAKAVTNKWRIAWACESLGTVALCESSWDEAIGLFREAARICRDIGMTGVPAAVGLTQAHLARSAPREAVVQLEEVMARAEAERIMLPTAVSALEAATEDPEEFRAFCRCFREEHPAVTALPFVQWFLEPTQPDCGLSNFGFWLASGRLDFGLEDQPSPSGAPQDPDRDSAAELQSAGWPPYPSPIQNPESEIKNGPLVLRAANGQDLWDLNRSAPRRLQRVSGDFAVQVVCQPVSQDRPAIGGLLLWKDPENFLRLERGTRGPDEISFQGFLANQELIVGRGRLNRHSLPTGDGGAYPASDPLSPSPAEGPRYPRLASVGTRLGEPVFLRLERRGDSVRAVCSGDGGCWFTVGHTAFPVEDPLQIGLHAIGQIDRLFYPGAYPEGTAIRFERLQLWR